MSRALSIPSKLMTRCRGVTTGLSAELLVHDVSIPLLMTFFLVMQLKDVLVNQMTYTECSPNVLQMFSNSCPLLLHSTQGLPPSFLRLLSVCCPFVVRLLFVLYSDNKRTTNGQQMYLNRTGMGAKPWVKRS